MFTMSVQKLVRIKTKQLMIITDTPGSSFDKVAMDFVGPLFKTRRGNEYILILQDQLTKLHGDTLIGSNIRDNSRSLCRQIYLRISNT